MNEIYFSSDDLILHFIVAYKTLSTELNIK